jgi:hypothetical protein
VSREGIILLIKKPVSVTAAFHAKSIDKLKR